MPTYDFCVVGGGIVGLATAMALLERSPGARLVLLEKEDALATHQTGHNRGVIHSGIYYAPGSLKADLCRRGERATKEFCTAHGIPFVTCGKTLVATNALELERLEALVGRARENGIEAERLDGAELRRCGCAMSARTRACRRASAWRTANQSPSAPAQSDICASRTRDAGRARTRS